MSSSALYQTCSSSLSSDSEVLECISSGLEEQNDTLVQALDVFFLLYAAALVFFLQAGFAMLCAGSVREKNVQNTMLKNILDACTGALSFWAVGYAFAYGDYSDGTETSVTFVGTEKFFLDGLSSSETAFWLFQFAFAATSATIVAGTLAERCQMIGYIIYSSVLTGFIYPVIVHSIWSNRGFLSPLINDPLFGVGVIDFAGSGVVHVTGGVAALLASIILGPRKGRFTDERTGDLLEKPQKIVGHSPSLQVLGTFILWFCWYGFNPGSTGSISTGGSIAALAATSTTLSAAAGGIMALVTEVIIIEHRTGEATFNLTTALNGCLSGLVAITGSCGFVEPWAAVVIGILSGLVYLSTSAILEKYHIDDAVDAIPVHLACGVLGLIVTGLFAKESYLIELYGDTAPQFAEHQGWLYDPSDGAILAAQVVALLWIFSWVGCLMGPFFLFLNYTGYFRADPLEEVIGLDISYHGRSAYENGEVPKLEFNHLTSDNSKSKIKEKKNERLMAVLQAAEGVAMPTEDGINEDSCGIGEDAKGDLFDDSLFDDSTK